VNSSSTNALLAQIESGDGDAKDQLFQLYRRRLKHTAASRMDVRLRKRVDPSDVAQEALILADNRLERYFSKRPLAFYPWLQKLVWEVMVTLYRKHKYARSRDYRIEVPIVSSPMEYEDDSLYLADDSRSDPLRRVIEEDLDSQLRSAIKALPIPDQEIIQMRHFGQLSNEEAAELLGISQSAAKMRHFRAIERLRDILGSLESKSNDERIPC
jgi:RNA polymerase sigma-70 factor (ECF subfamily)